MKKYICLLAAITLLLIVSFIFAPIAWNFEKLLIACFLCGIGLLGIGISIYIEKL